MTAEPKDLSGFKDHPIIKHELYTSCIEIAIICAGRYYKSYRPRFLCYEDLFSVGLEACTECVEKYDVEGGANFKTFSNMIIKGRILDEIRKFGNRLRNGDIKFVVDYFEDKRGLFNEIYNKPTVLDKLEKKDLAKQVLKAVNDLPELQREVISLHYYSGIQLRDISEALGFGKDGVHYHYRLALKALAVSLKGVSL